MKNNNNFSDDLGVYYLSLLARYNYKEEFLRLYNTMISYLKEALTKSTNQDELRDINNIFTYYKSVQELEVTK